MTSLDERARAIFEEHRHWYGRVPDVGADHVCPFCLGAVNTGYSACVSCSPLFLGSDCPPALRSRVVPMTTVLGGNSPWYSALWNYKFTQWAEYAKIVAALAYLWLTIHRSNLERTLGGEADHITIVPSKRGVAYDKQPLRRLLTPLGDRLVKTLECVRPELYGRASYAPSMFEPSGVSVSGKRVIVVEDTWTTGATALSACGALYASGAKEVVLTPIARLTRIEYITEDHPYRVHLRGPYDLTHWPR